MNAEMQPIARELAIGIAVAGSRHETDLIGRIYVPADSYHGAQTQCSFIQFSIGDDRMPKRVCHAYGYVKKSGVAGQRRRRSPAALEGRDHSASHRRDPYGCRFDLDHGGP